MGEDLTSLPPAEVQHRLAEAQRLQQHLQNDLEFLVTTHEKLQEKLQLCSALKGSQQADVDRNARHIHDLQHALQVAQRQQASQETNKPAVRPCTLLHAAHAPGVCSSRHCIRMPLFIVRCLLALCCTLLPSCTLTQQALHNSTFFRHDATALQQGRAADKHSAAGLTNRRAGATAQAPFDRNAAGTGANHAVVPLHSSTGPGTETNDAAHALLDLRSIQSNTTKADSTGKLHMRSPVHKQKHPVSTSAVMPPGFALSCNDDEEDHQPPSDSAILSLVSSDVSSQSSAGGALPALAGAAPHSAEPFVAEPHLAESHSATANSDNDGAGPSGMSAAQWRAQKAAPLAQQPAAEPERSTDEAATNPSKAPEAQDSHGQPVNGTRGAECMLRRVSASAATASQPAVQVRAAAPTVKAAQFNAQLVRAQLAKETRIAVDTAHLNSRAQLKAQRGGASNVLGAARKENAAREAASGARTATSAVHTHASKDEVAQVNAGRVQPGCQGMMVQRDAQRRPLSSLDNAGGAKNAAVQQGSRLQVPKLKSQMAADGRPSSDAPQAANRADTGNTAPRGAGNHQADKSQQPAAAQHAERIEVHQEQQQNAQLQQVPAQLQRNNADDVAQKASLLQTQVQADHHDGARFDVSQGQVCLCE